MYTREQLNFDFWFTEKFFEPAKPNELSYAATFPLPKSAETLHDFLNSPEGKDFQQVIINIMDKFIAWAKANEIDSSSFTRFKSIYATYLGGDADTNVDYFSLYTIGIPLLVRIHELIELDTIPLNIRTSVIEKMGADIIKCGPGSYTIIVKAYLDLMAYLNISVTLSTARSYIAEDFIKILLKKYNIPTILEAHYINAVLNEFADVLGTNVIEDPKIARCDAQILAALFKDFSHEISGIKSVVTPETIMENIFTAAQRNMDETISNLNLMGPLEKIINKINASIEELNLNYFSSTPENNRDIVTFPEDVKRMINHFEEELVAHGKAGEKVLKKLLNIDPAKGKISRLDCSQVDIFDHFIFELHRYGIDKKFYEHEDIFITQDNVTYYKSWKADQLIYLSLFERLCQSSYLQVDKCIEKNLPASKAILYYFPNRPLKLAHIYLPNAKTFDKKHHAFFPYCIETLATSTNSSVRGELIHLLQSDLLNDSDRLNFVSQLSQYLQSTELNESDDKEDERLNLIAALHELLAPNYPNLIAVLNKLAPQDIKEFVHQLRNFNSDLSEEHLGNEKKDELLLLAGTPEFIKNLIANNKFPNTNYLAYNLTPLALVIQYGRPELFEILVENGANINSEFAGGNLPILWAAANSNTEMLDALLKNGADPNQLICKANVSAKSALHLAVESADLEKVKILLKHNANPNLKDKNGNTPLFIAAEKGNLAICKVLLESDLIDADVKDSKNMTILQYCLTKGWRSLLELLVVSGKIDLNLPLVTQTKKLTPLMLAIQVRNLELVKWLLENKVNINWANSEGYTALHYAANDELIEIFKLLFNAGVSLDPEGISRLYQCAINNNAVEVLKIIIFDKAEFNCNTAHTDLPPLLLAVKQRKKALVELLLQSKNINPNIASTNGSTVLHFAAFQGDVDTVTLLLDAGANPNLPNKKGNTALHLAAQKDQSAIFQLLLTSKADTKIANFEGEYPLHTLIRFNAIDTMNLLTHADIDFAQNTYDGITPLQLAIQHKAYNIIDVLIKKGINVNAIDRHGETALHYSVKRSRIDLVKQLLNAGALIDIADENGETSFYKAILNHDKDIVFFLLEHGKFNIDSANLAGLTPLHLAVRQHMTDVIEKLIDKGANPNLVDSDGFTVFHLMVIKYMETAFYLLESDRVNPSIVDANGFTALYHAVKQKNVSLIKAMLQHKIHGPAFRTELKNLFFIFLRSEEIDIFTTLTMACYEISQHLPFESDENGQSLIQLLAESNQVGILRFILQQNDVETKNAVTAFCFASIQKGDLISLNTLLTAGMDPNSANDQNLTLLLCALQSGNNEIIKMLLAKGANPKQLDSAGNRQQLSPAMDQIILVYKSVDILNESAGTNRFDAIDCLLKTAEFASKMQFLNALSIFKEIETLANESLGPNYINKNAISNEQYSSLKMEISKALEQAYCSFGKNKVGESLDHLKKELERIKQKAKPLKIYQLFSGWSARNNPRIDLSAKTKLSR